MLHKLCIGIFAGAVLLCILFFLLSRTAPQEAAKELKPLSYVKEEYMRCIELDEDPKTGECLNELAVYAYDTYGTKRVASEFDSLSYEAKHVWCHEVMHYMGWRAFETEEDIARAFLQSSELCDSGMYHGVMEEYLRQHGLGGDIADIIKNTCARSLASNPDLSDGTLSLCYHGLGHGLMYITTADLRRSLDYCDLLSNADSHACYGGVFMEYAAAKSVGPLSDAQRPDLSDFNYCSELSPKQKTACLSRQGMNNLVVAKGDVGEAMRLCLHIEGQDQIGCFQAVGANTPTPSRSHADSAIACKSAIGVASSSYEHCITGALGFVAQLELGDPQGMIDFCGATEDAQQISCYEQAGKNLLFWLRSGETIEEKCRLFPEGTAYQMCMKGAGAL